jgi:hypothetical protein
MKAAESSSHAPAVSEIEKLKAERRAKAAARRAEEEAAGPAPGKQNPGASRVCDLREPWTREWRPCGCADSWWEAPLTRSLLWGMFGSAGELTRPGCAEARYGCVPGCQQLSHKAAPLTHVPSCENPSLGVSPFLSRESSSTGVLMCGVCIATTHPAALSCAGSTAEGKQWCFRC